MITVKDIESRIRYDSEKYKIVDTDGFYSHEVYVEYNTSPIPNEGPNHYQMNVSVSFSQTLYGDDFTAKDRALKPFAKAIHHRLYGELYDAVYRIRSDATFDDRKTIINKLDKLLCLIDCSA